MSLRKYGPGRIAGLAIVILTLVGAGCATKGYVAKQVDPLDARVATAEAEIGENSSGIAKLDEKDGELERDISRVDERALGAQGSADEAAGRAGQARDRADSGYELAEEGNRKAEHVEKGLANVHNYRMVAQESMPFGFDKSELTAEAKAQLERVVKAAGDTKDYVIELKGFTDTTGNAKYNLALSERRAQSVLRHLTLEHKIPLHRVHVMGFGSESPVADNKSRDGRQQNRRVEVSLYKAGVREVYDIPARTTSQSF